MASTPTTTCRLAPASSGTCWGTIAQQIEAGTLDWEQLVTIEAEHKSVPSGDLRYAPDGSEYTVRYLAERMMQKSDNTATDVLDLPGRAGKC